MSRLQRNKPEEITKFMDRVGLHYHPVQMGLTREAVREMLMSLGKFVSDRSGLCFTVIDSTEITEELVETLLAGLQ